MYLIDILIVLLKKRTDVCGVSLGEVRVINNETKQDHLCGQILRRRGVGWSEVHFGSRFGGGIERHPGVLQSLSHVRTQNKRT